MIVFFSGLSVLQGEERAILDDGGLQILVLVLADFLCYNSGTFVAGLRNRIIYLETQCKGGSPV